MKLSTIDGIIDTFDDSYAMRGKELYEKSKSVDKFVELSHDYAMGLPASNFEKEIFLSYFKDHVTSMYRRDFEPILLESEKKDTFSNNQRQIIKFSFHAIYGTIGSLLGFAVTKSPVGAVVGGAIGVIVGSYFANTDSKVKAPKNTILGTDDYEKQIRNKLYDSLLDLK